MTAHVSAGRGAATAGPAIDAAAVTPSNTVRLVDGAGNSRTAVALFVGGAGNVAVTTEAGSTAVFTGVLAGTILPIRCTHVRATSTTATNITAMF